MVLREKLIENQECRVTQAVGLLTTSTTAAVGKGGFVSKTGRGKRNPDKMSDPSNIESTDDQQQHSESEEIQPPLPFNPLTTATHDGAAVSTSSVGNSVVRDLMRVYESLTQSSTPHVSSGGSHQPPPPPGYPPQHQQHGQYVQQQRQDNPHAPPAAPTGYTIPSPPVPYHVTTGGTQPRDPQYNYAPPHNPYYPDTYGHQQRTTGGPPPFVVGLPDQHSGYPVPPHEQQHSSADSRQQDDEDDEDNEDEDQNQDQSSGRTRRKRRGSSFDSGSPSASGNNRGGKSRKKGKASDGRWSKRFTWPEDLHRDFVSAIFDVGLKHSSPSTIMEHMPKHEQITTERIKSHLQKYRLHRAKSKKEFLSSYEASLSNFQARGLNGVKTISGGDVPAHLSYSVVNESSSPATALATGKGATVQASKGHGNEPKFETTSLGVNSGQNGENDALMLPQLTEAEKQSPIGAAMGYLMGLFFSLKQQLMIQRAAEKAGGEDQSKSPVQAVFNSFVSGGAPVASGVPVGQEYSHDGAMAQTSIDPNQSAKAPSSSSNMMAGPSATRTNLEESNMMKREMQNQMALQNKMRALKQQELNKYKDVEAPLPGQELKDSIPSSLPLSPTPVKHEEESPKVGEASVSRAQGAGETAAADAASGGRHRPRGLSMGGSDEFWNTDVVDEQLFEFLMNN